VCDFFSNLFNFLVYIYGMLSYAHDMFRDGKGIDLQKVSNILYF
jgi:hypothetical protein